MVEEARKKPPMNVTTDSRLFHEEEDVRRRAYELYEARGREDGHDLDDWFSAEAEFIEASAKTTAKTNAG